MNTIWIVLPILTALMFQLGLDVDVRSFARVLRNPLPIVIGIVGQLILLPLIAFVIAYVFELPPVYFLGMILIACSPSGSSSNTFSMLAGGDVPLAITLTALGSIITLFTIPVVMLLATDYVSAHLGTIIHLPVGKLLAQNIVLLFVPIVAGVLFRMRWVQKAAQLHRILGKFAFPALLLLATVFFVANYKTILDNILTLGLCITLLILVGIGSGALLSYLGRLNGAQQRTIVFEVGIKNGAEAIAIATSPLLFASEEMATPAIIYALMMNVIMLTYLKLLPKRTDGHV
jgi:BASS family bile acid:Na+ symporter